MGIIFEESEFNIRNALPQIFALPLEILLTTIPSYCGGKIDLKPNDILETIELIMNLVEKVKSNSFSNMKDDLLQVTDKIAMLASPENQNVSKMLRSLLLIIYGEFGQIDRILFSFLNINESQFEMLKSLTVSFTQVLKAPASFISSHSTMILKSFSEKKSGVVKRLTDKLETEGKLSNQDLFKSFDVDQSGKINLEEF